MSLSPENVKKILIPHAYLLAKMAKIMMQFSQFLSPHEEKCLFSRYT